MKTSQNSDTAKRARRGDPITVCGLTLYPITMDYYEDYVGCKDVLELRMGTLPVRYAIQNYGNALFAMTRDEDPSLRMMFGKFLHLLSLSLRIFDDKLMISNVYVDAEKNLAFVLVNPTETAVEIKPNDFQALREGIALLNGATLPDESDNADILADDLLRKKILSSNAKDLDVNTTDLVASVAYLSQVREKDVYEWTVLEFENRRKAIDRDKRFTIYGLAETSGYVQFKNSNPYPSWCFDVKDDSFGTMKTEKIQKTIEG